MYATIVKFSAGLAFLLAILAGQSMCQTQVKGSGWTASTNVGPALATDGINAYIAWVDSATSDIYFATYTGTGWANAQTVSGTSGGKKWTAMSDVTPAWSYDGTNFYLVWKGKSVNNDIWFSEYSGGAWSLQAVVEGSGPSWTAETDVAPAASFQVFPATLYWKGASGNKIWVSYFNDPSPGWSQQQVFAGPTTNVAPGVEAAPYNTGVTPLFLKSASSNDIFAWLDATSFQVSGPGWKAETKQAPAAALDLNGTDIVFWTGQTGTSIFYSYNEAGSPLVFLGAPVWSEQKTVSGASTNAAPTVAEANGPSMPVALLAWKNASDTSIWYSDVSSLP